MARYIVTPMLGMHGIPYYVVVDTSKDHSIEGYGCETWARHRAEALNRQAGDRRPVHHADRHEHRA